MDEDLSEEEIKAVIERLPEELIVAPLSPETIGAILDILCKVTDDEVLEDSLFGACDDATDYSLRASTKKKLGLYEEALKDYSMACTLEPENHMHFLDKAEMHNKLGQNSDALNDALRVFEMIRDTCIDNVENLLDILQLAFIFDNCQDAKMTAVTMLEYVKGFNSLIPSISFDQDGGFTIEKGGQEHASSLFTFEAFFVMIHDIEAKYGKDMEVTAILERLKNEIAISRSIVGF